jgi:hypothetical protein
VQPCSVVRTKIELQALHTVCRSFPKISSALSAKFAADRNRQKILIQGLSMNGARQSRYGV